MCLSKKLKLESRAELLVCQTFSFTGHFYMLLTYCFPSLKTDLKYNKTKTCAEGEIHRETSGELNRVVLERSQMS